MRKTLLRMGHFMSRQRDILRDKRDIFKNQDVPPAGHLCVSPFRGDTMSRWHPGARQKCPAVPVGVLAIALLLTLAGVAPTHAAPPPSGSDDAQLLAPFADWLRDQHDLATGIACCSLADCRAVAWRTAGSEVEVLVSSGKFPEGPDAWLQVPQTVIQRGAQNPTGLAVVCWSRYRAVNNGFYCVWLPEMS